VYEHLGEVAGGRWQTHLFACSAQDAQALLRWHREIRKAEASLRSPDGRARCGRAMKAAHLASQHAKAIR